MKIKSILNTNSQKIALKLAKIWVKKKKNGNVNTKNMEIILLFT